MVASMGKVIQAVALSCLIIATSYGQPVKKDKCLGNHACKRVFYLLSDYTPKKKISNKKKSQQRDSVKNAEIVEPQKAATIIQTQWRGHATRNNDPKVVELKEEVLCCRRVDQALGVRVACFRAT